MLRCVGATLGMCLALAAGALSIPAPPKPPADWEAAADQRFAPLIEQTLIDISRPGFTLERETAEALWAGWGPDAAERLRALLDEDVWQGFHSYTERLYFHCPFESERQRIETYVLDALGPDDAERADYAYTRARTLVRTYGEIRGEDAVPFLIRLSDDERPHVSVAGVRGLLATNSRAGFQAAVSHMYDASQAENPALRRGAVVVMRHIGSMDMLQSAIAIAREIDPGLAREVEAQLAAERKRLDELAKTLAGRARAQEPMALLDEGARR